MTTQVVLLTVAGSGNALQWVRRGTLIVEQQNLSCRRLGQTLGTRKEPRTTTLIPMRDYAEISSAICTGVCCHWPGDLFRVYHRRSVRRARAALPGEVPKRSSLPFSSGQTCHNSFTGLERVH